MSDPVTAWLRLDNSVPASSSSPPAAVAESFECTEWTDRERESYAIGVTIDPLFEYLSQLGPVSALR